MAWHSTPRFSTVTMTLETRHFRTIDLSTELRFKRRVDLMPKRFAQKSGEAGINVFGMIGLREVEIHISKYTFGNDSGVCYRGRGVLGVAWHGKSLYSTATMTLYLRTETRHFRTIDSVDRARIQARKAELKTPKLFASQKCGETTTNVFGSHVTDSDTGTHGSA